MAQEVNRNLTGRVELQFAGVEVYLELLSTTCWVFGQLVHWLWIRLAAIQTESRSGWQEKMRSSLTVAKARGCC